MTDQSKDRLLSGGKPFENIDEPFPLKPDKDLTYRIGGRDVLVEMVPIDQMKSGLGPFPGTEQTHKPYPLKPGEVHPLGVELGFGDVNTQKGTSGAYPNVLSGHPFEAPDSLGPDFSLDDPELKVASRLAHAPRARDKVLVSMDPAAPAGFHFHGNADKIKVDDGERFHTLDAAEIERIVGHPIVLGDDATPNNLDDSDIRVLGAGLAVRDTVINNPHLSRKEKLRILNKIMRDKRAAAAPLRRQAADLRASVLSNEEQIAANLRLQDALAEVGVWLQRPLSLAKPDGSALHRLREAGHAGEIQVLFTDEGLPVEYAESLDALHSFVVEHNWAGVLSNAEIVGEGGNDVSMPATAACFEFVVGGKRVMAIVNEDPADIAPSRMAILVKLEAIWAVLLTYEIGDDWKARTLELPPDLTEPMQPLADLIVENVHAIGILLETKIVERTAVRIDAKLNSARIKRGKLPMFDYHVVSLARRERVAPRLAEELDPNREIIRKRWHLVRPHWRQYADHRTRIDWHSRGDLDLGMVDKHYKL